MLRQAYVAPPIFRPGRPKTGQYSSTMPQIMNALVPVAVGAVGIVLILGLYTMMRGKSANASQKLMRWRVGLQAVAIVVIMAAIYFRQQTG